MNVKFLNQPKDVNFLDVLKEKLENNKFSKIWLVAGFAKDSALDLIYDSVAKAVANGATVECVFGLDKKNTSKDMLLKFLSLGCTVRFHINGDQAKFESRMFIFESEEGDSYVYVPGSKLSEGGITSNYTLIEEISYSKEEKVEFGKVKAALESGLMSDEFEVLTEEKLKDLASTGEILARITERKIPSINELYNQTTSTEENTATTYDEESGVDYKELLNSDIDIAIDSEETIKVQESLGDEVEHKIKKVEKEPEDKVITKMVGLEKEPDFENANTLIMQLSNCTSGEIKIAPAIALSLKTFFNYPDFFHVEKDEKDNLNETQAVELEIFENESNFQADDDNAQIIFNTKNALIRSEVLKQISLDDGDIMRLIKQNNSKFRCEIIKQNTNEFEVWQNFCTIQIKGTTKKIGVI